tara:strand:- start:69 stop:254 length:186 start_codon:yes stop_codon:yes gene_type:complete
MNIFVSMILNRLREPSTFAGLGGLLAAVGISLPPEMQSTIVTIVGGLAALASMFMREKGDN